MGHLFKQVSNGGAIAAHYDLDVYVDGVNSLPQNEAIDRVPASAPDFVLSGFNGYDERAQVHDFKLISSAFVDATADITASMSPSGFGGELYFDTMWTKINFSSEAKSGVFDNSLPPETHATSLAAVTGSLKREYDFPGPLQTEQYMLADVAFNLAGVVSRTLPGDDDISFWSVGHFIHMRCGLSEVKATFNPSANNFQGGWTIQTRLRSALGTWWDGTPRHYAPNGWATEQVVGRTLNKVYNGKIFRTRYDWSFDSEVKVGNGQPDSGPAWTAPAVNYVKVTSATPGLTGYAQHRHDNITGSATITISNAVFTQNTLPGDPPNDSELPLFP